jgi:hypothetical protein
MIRRSVRVNFRLTVQEEVRVTELLAKTHCWGISELCRMALRQMYERETKPASPTGPVVIRGPGCMTPVSDENAKKASRSVQKKGKKPLTK